MRVVTVWFGEDRGLKSNGTKSYSKESYQNDAMKIDPEIQEEINRLDKVVDDFASEMKGRLREQAIKGV